MGETEKIKIFVRETLGCECPEEVFTHIDHICNVPLEEDMFITSKLIIGNRLLIYVVDADDPDFVERTLTFLLRIGREERNTLGLNRFRLVLATNNRGKVAERAKKVFDLLPERDTKTHLHVVDREAIPFEVRG
jgi:hypothetical protein